MSANTSAEGPTHMDYAEHTRTYHRFIKGVQISIIGIVVLLVLMATFLV